MKSLYDPSTVDELKRRLATLTPDSPRLWGKMTPAQMLCHCSLGMESAVGDRKPLRMFIGRLLGGLVKPSFLSEKPVPKNSPTAPWLVIKDDRDLETERARLISLIERFSTGGPEACTQHPHSFFGKLTPEEWGKSSYKHLDHHLQQFGA